jgi:hypothetical protein
MGFFNHEVSARYNVVMRRNLRLFPELRLQFLGGGFLGLQLPFSALSLELPVIFGISWI